MGRFWNCPFTLWLFPKTAACFSAVICLCFGRLSHWKAHTTNPPLQGKNDFCQAVNCLINKADLRIHNGILKASAQIVVTLTWRVFGPKSSLLGSFWPDPSPSCCHELLLGLTLATRPGQELAMPRAAAPSPPGSPYKVGNGALAKWTSCIKKVRKKIHCQMEEQERSDILHSQRSWTQWEWPACSKKVRGPWVRLNTYMYDPC